MIAFRAAERRRTFRAALLFVVLTAVLAFPLSVRPADHVIANIYYSLRHTLAYSENLIGSAIIAAPILWLTGNSVLAMNLVALLSAALCGLGAYVLARQVGAGAAGAVVSGLVFAFSPPRFLRLDQLHLATIQWVPFGLASLHAYLGRGRPFDLRLSAAFFTVQALSSGHGCAFIPRSGPAEAGHHLPGREG
ncbi:MAG: hypothetical protein AUH72_00975 [Acidobacteria bacterium 13_1_40CM_4_65_8]|nr:MAG: hypothetical protein AUH72_00975 [Acidobacteria bacterium 13_1_40CM_4_65_8]